MILLNPGIQFVENVEKKHKIVLRFNKFKRMLGVGVAIKDIIEKNEFNLCD